MNRSVLILSGLLVFNLLLYANNVNITGTVLTDYNASDNLVSIQFDISWENSWNVSSAPSNWDAVWLFVKYRIGNGEWQHVSLNSTGHNAPVGSAISLGLQNPASAYNSISNPGIGAFIYRTTTGYGAVSFTGVKLCWNYGADGVADDANVTVKVFGIEMVYVNSGNFYAGDGTANSGFTRANDATYPYTPYYINSSTGPVIQGCNAASSISNLSTAGSLDLGTTTTTASLASGFPNGYNAFYCMKHEISQRMYMEFLNTLTRTQQNSRTASSLAEGVTSVTNTYVMSNTTAASYRNGIRCSATVSANDPIDFFCDLDGDGSGNESNDGEWIVCNYISWSDLTAFLDWSGLRPMSELEFEKICRGIGNTYVSGEYAWGTNSNVSPATSISSSGQYNESVGAVAGGNANCAYNNSTSGPVRAGAFAKSSTTTRTASGAGYFGVLDMSGSMWEFAVVISNSTGRSFTGLHGNGEINSTGNADVSAWPSTNGIGVGIRGGYWSGTVASYMTVSYRGHSGGGGYTNKAEYNGGRGVRTSP